MLSLRKLRYSFMAAAILVFATHPIHAQQRTWTDSWASNANAPNSFVADSTACSLVAAEIVSATGNDMKQELGRCLKKRSWVPVRLPNPAPSCEPVSIRLVGASTLPDSGRFLGDRLTAIAREASSTRPPFAMARWKDLTVVGSITSYGSLSLDFDFSKTDDYRSHSFLRRSLTSTIHSDLEEFAQAPIVVAFKPRCFGAYMAPDWWR